MFNVTVGLAQSASQLHTVARRSVNGFKVASLALSLGAANVALAQSDVGVPAKGRWEFMMSSGALVPTGALREVLKDAMLSTAQLTYVVKSNIAVTAMTGWARSRDVASTGRPKLDVFTYDVGAELRAPRNVATNKLSVRTLFAGAGVGARSYNYRNLDVDATHNAAVYGSIGAEVGARRARLRLEVRDYVSRFTPLNGANTAATRNDVVAMLGLRLVRR